MSVVCVMLAAALVVADGGFEQDARGWTLGKRANRVVEGAGLGGTKGLVWENADPGVYQFATQPLACEPGVAYAFSGWVKDEGTTNATRNGRLTNISIEWRDSNGKFISMIGARPVVDNQEQEAGWVKYAGQTPVMPADFGGASIVCSAIRGSTGKVTFDDVEVRALAVEPVPSIVSSAYRDMAAEGTVTFAVRTVLNPQRDPTESVTARFRCVGVGGELVLPTKVSSKGFARATTDVSALARGRHPVRFELFRKDGSPLGSRELVFERVDRLPSRKVTIDGHHRAIVDGKPFFPLGLYSSSREVENLDVYCEGPFNCILPYALKPDARELDPYQAKGLKVIVCISDYSGFRGSKLRNESDERAYTTRYMRAMKDHPALLAWYLADELEVEKAGSLKQRNLQVRMEDPDHPTYIVLDNADRPMEFVEGYDVVGMDPYPIGNSGGSMRARLAIASLFPEGARRGMYGFRPQWQVPQNFDWAWHRPWAAKEEGAHMPNLAELRNMNWQAIASGANGLVGWWFSGMIRNLRDKGRTEEFNRAWGDVKTAYREVAEKVPLLLSVEPAPTVAKKPANLSARCWRKDGKGWLLVVNRTYDPVTGAVALSDGRKVDVSLDGLGYRFIEL